jgi:hypothetical protein
MKSADDRPPSSPLSSGRDKPLLPPADSQPIRRSGTSFEGTKPLHRDWSPIDLPPNKVVPQSPPSPPESFWQRLRSIGKGLFVGSTVTLPVIAAGPIITHAAPMPSQNDKASEVQRVDNIHRTTAADNGKPPEPAAVPDEVWHLPQPSEYIMSAAAIALLVKTTLDTGNLIKLGLEFYDRFKRKPEAEEVDALLAEADKSTHEVPTIASGGLVGDVATTLSEQMDELKERTQATLRDPGLSALDLDQQLTRLKREYCSKIHMMRKFSRGTLPQAIEAEWDACDCEQFAF